MSEPALGRWPVKLELPVQWGDMDAFAHVNNTVYLRWFESGRIAYFAKVAVPRTLDDAGPRPILARATIDFRAPLEHPDTVTVEATVTRLGRTSFTMGYRVTSQKSGKVAAEGEGVVVLVDPASGQPVPLPDALRAGVTALEASAS